MASALTTFFQLMTRRYERASTVLTSNKGCEEWDDIFGDDVMAAALMSSLVHQCHLVTIRGSSTSQTPNRREINLSMSTEVYFRIPNTNSKEGVSRWR